MNKIFSGLLLSIMCFTGFVFAQENKDIAVSDAWVQPVPPFLKVTAAYMVISNHSATDKVLASVTTPVAQAVEFHKMFSYAGFMKMTVLEDIPIPAKSKVFLNQGTSHLMLIQLTQVLHIGDRVLLILHFKDGSTIVTRAEVKGKEQKQFSVMPGMKM